MREFPVEITTSPPEGTTGAEVAERRAAEAVRAGEPAAAGRPARPWRPVGESRGTGIRRAEDEEDPHGDVSGTPSPRPWTDLGATPPEPTRTTRAVPESRPTWSPV
ncbi:muconolactone Delta-isomerase family protein [Streptomyces sp. NPDC048514]|uniref:muconolactone Delta-isomerase family protein n=1 Tax=Streptomyces sp. NPDC048514 TaxID=3365564 RepID=UPI00371D32B9